MALGKCFCRYPAIYVGVMLLVHFAPPFYGDTPLIIPTKVFTFSSRFRSYREQCFQESLSPGNNVVVGKNGAGKSNFFAAIQFVLCEKFSNLSAAERKDLFHVGSGRPVLAVYVEVVFDNSDGRLVIPGRPEEKEVRIRRTVGLKQDEFRVNDRRFSALEVRKLLESAGFSATNPYYIVEQGQISNLANMSDEERCQLIKDVAGTRVYEIKRKKSEKILEETEVKHEKIEESIAKLDERLAELRAESSELLEFQEIDRERKCIEHAISSLELANVESILRKLDSEGGAESNRLAMDNDVDVADRIQAAEQQVFNCASRIKQLEGELQSLEKERDMLVNGETVQTLGAMESAAAADQSKKEKTVLLDETKRQEERLEALNKEYEAIQIELRGQQELIDRENDKLMNIEKMERALQARRGRRVFFKNIRERDSWIKSETEKIKETIDNQRKELQVICDSIKDVEKRLQEDQQSTSDLLITTESKLSNFEARRKSLVNSRDLLHMKQRKLWQKLHEQKGLVEKAKDDYALARGQLERVTRLDIRQGLQSLQEVLEELNNPRLRKAVHGQVIDLIDVSKGYETAVEVTAGNALFNVVVDSFEVSAMLLDQMNSRRKPGRVSFFPLDTCSGSSLVNIEGSDGSLLADHISCGSMFGGIIAELFGSTVVVASIENGERVARKYGCDAVTLEGDQVSRRGGITGGFIESRSLKITSFNAKKDTAAKLLREEEVLAGLSEEVTTIDKEVSDVKNELESLMEEMSRLEKTSDIGRDSFAHSQRRIRLERQKEELHVARRTLEMNIDCNQSSIASLQQEAKEALKPSWTDDDERQLERLMDDAKNHRKKISDLTVQSVKLATSAQVKEHSRNNARSRLSILTNRLCELGWTSALSNAMLSEQASCDNAISSITKRLKEVQKLIDEAVRQEQESKEALETLRGELDVVSRFAQEQQELNDMNRMNRSFYVQQRDEAMEKIKRLGSLPASKENYSGMSLAMLMSHHMKCKEKLKKYSHVNRKAADQYTALMGTKEDLAKQEGNLQEELKSIRELMDHLDQKKDEAVERTYKQIQYQFEEVFKELVATDDCHGQLQLIWSNARKEAGEDPYVAAQINVSFGHGASVTDLKQLSGGQKSLVALALIFAIQRCDPAPFYLFDEIDAALDAEYRMSVARLLAKESKNCQFITATFKNEMLEVADHVLGVFFHNKISRIQAITIEEGTKLLKQAALEERKRVRESNE